MTPAALDELGAPTMPSFIIHRQGHCQDLDPHHPLTPAPQTIVKRSAGPKCFPCSASATTSSQEKPPLKPRRQNVRNSQAYRQSSEDRGRRPPSRWSGERGDPHFQRGTSASSQSCKAKKRKGNGKCKCNGGKYRAVQNVTKRNYRKRSKGNDCKWRGRW